MSTHVIDESFSSAMASSTTRGVMTMAGGRVGGAGRRPHGSAADPSHFSAHGGRRRSREVVRPSAARSSGGDPAVLVGAKDVDASRSEDAIAGTAAVDGSSRDGDDRAASGGTSSGSSKAAANASVHGGSVGSVAREEEDVSAREGDEGEQWFSGIPAALARWAVVGAATGVVSLGVMATVNPKP